MLNGVGVGDVACELMCFAATVIAFSLPFDAAIDARFYDRVEGVKSRPLITDVVLFADLIFITDGD